MHLIKYLLKLPSDPMLYSIVVGHDDRATRSVRLDLNLTCMLVASPDQSPLTLAQYEY